MKSYVKTIIKHPLFSGSAIMVVGSNLNNVFTYVYHLIFGRVLGPAQYGELVSIISLVGLVSVSFNFFGLVIVKFASTSKKNELFLLFKWFDRKTTRIGALLGVLVLIFSSQLANFLHVDIELILLVSLLTIVNVKLFTARSFLNGLLKFKEVVIGTNLNVIGRIIVGITLVYFGFEVFGAVLGIFAASVATTLYYYKYLGVNKTEGVPHKFKKTKEIVRYTFPVFVLSLSTMSFFSSDVLLVKHYFTSYDAGIYGALANMGKIIFYALAPISAVMFPMVSKKHSKGESSKKLLYLSSSLVAIGLSVVLVIYKIFPELAITVLFGSQFLQASSLLFMFGVVMAIFSFSSLVINYHLSVEKFASVWFMVIAAIVQVVGITLYHDSLRSIVQVSLTAVAILTVGLITYSLYEQKRA